MRFAESGNHKHRKRRDGHAGVGKIEVAQRLRNGIFELSGFNPNNFKIFLGMFSSHPLPLAVKVLIIVCSQYFPIDLHYIGATMLFICTNGLRKRALFL